MSEAGRRKMGQLTEIKSAGEEGIGRKVQNEFHLNRRSLKFQQNATGGHQNQHKHRKKAIEKVFKKYSV